MKLAIYTQYRENYGAHTWNGEGECPQYWKFKGGDTYVVPSLSPTEVQKIEKLGIPVIAALINYQSDYGSEQIVKCEIIDDSIELQEDAVYLQYSENKWWASRKTLNEYGLMQPNIVYAESFWAMLPDGEQEEYSTFYLLIDGRTVDSNELMLETAKGYVC